MLKTLVLSLFASTALAHYTLDYPKSRGFDAEKEVNFCGGFPAGPRQPFPLTNAPIWVNSHHESATLWAFISTKPDPTTFADFNTTANGTSIPLLTNAFQVAKGERCWNVNFEKLNLGLTNGSEITLQLKYDGGDSALYQCSDLVLLSDFKVADNETCTNDAAIANTSAPSASGSSSAAPGASSSAATKPAGSATVNTAALGAVGIVALVAAHAVLL